MELIKQKLNLMDTEELAQKIKRAKQNYFENANKTGRCLAFHGDLDGLQAWHLAGVDLNQTGYDGNTPANVAKAAGHAKVIEFFNKLAS